MTKELDEKLVANYPKIFINRNAPMTETAMCWGFECMDGWYFLIDNLCACIQGYIDLNNIPQVEAFQVKEKFGSLRFYVDGENEKINGMIWLAEYMSAKICEECGKEGKIIEKGNWYMCRCPEHSSIKK